MSDDEEERKPALRRSSSVPPVPDELPRTLAMLINSNPITEAPTPATTMTDSEVPSPVSARRRSSVSILQTLVNASLLLPTDDARRRNFLVGAGRHTSNSATGDMASYFPDGRLLTIMVATWNTGEASDLYEQNFTPNTKRPAQPKERMLNDLADILLPTFIDYVADLIVVSTQEVSATKNSIDWEILLQEVVGPTHVLFHSVHFGTLSLCVFLRRDLIWYCTEPEEAIIKFRAMTPLRTKGSVAITFNLFGTSFMLINSHFEAGEGNEARGNRKLNFQNTTAKLDIPHEFLRRKAVTNKHLQGVDRQEELKRSESSSSLDSNAQLGPDMTTACDFVFWAGDMNFRVEMTPEEAATLAHERKYPELLEKDEFLTAKQKPGSPFGEFKEAKIDFAPTFKYDLRASSDVYSKNRTPSYTDRILFREKTASTIECTRYQSIENVKYSDHKPVVAHFRVKLKPGMNTGNLSYGKFNHEVYRRGCEQRERHLTFNVGVRNNGKRRTTTARSSVCVLQ